LLCPECEGTMLASTSPFLKKDNGEKMFYITYVCESCGFEEDYKANTQKRNRKEDIPK